MPLICVQLQARQPRLLENRCAEHFGAVCGGNGLPDMKLCGAWGQRWEALMWNGKALPLPHHAWE